MFNIEVNFNNQRKCALLLSYIELSPQF